MIATQPEGVDPAEHAQFDAALNAALGSAVPIAEASISIGWMSSPVGPLLLGANDRAVVLVEFAELDQLGTQVARLRKHLNRPLMHDPDHPLLRTLRTQLIEFFEAKRREFDVPLEYHGSEFQERVWTALRQIPFGETCSYAAIARTLGDPKSTRAVGAANGSNPIAIVIPCHRVVNANGELGGYGGGRWRKQVLLDLERGQGRLF